MNQYFYKSFDFRGNALDLLDLLRGEPHAFFLDSSQYDPHRGRYSFIGFDPFDVFVGKGKDTLELLKKKFTQYAGARGRKFTSPFSPLTAGIVGYLGYDYGLYQEKIRLQAEDDLILPDCSFGFYDCILTIDHFAQKLYVTSSGLPEKDGHLRERRASQRLAHMVEKLAPYLNKGPECFSICHPEEPACRRSRRSDEGSHEILQPFARLLARQRLQDDLSVLPLTLRCNFSKQQYMKAVQKALNYISCGDIYQVNLSQRFEFDLTGHEFDSLALHQALRNLSPVSFGGYLNCGGFSLISNSPERFLRLHKGIARTRPMKGTRPRGRNDAQDQKFREELIHSAKEKAELLMITDLLRNDLGRVCDYGSIRVKETRAIEEYQYVFQATSTVEGDLGKGKDCFDLIRACFPGGSITGCPKIRAMEIIEELEPTRRGMYTGSMGYISFDGNMDFNILIRTLLAYRDTLYFQVGAGIVADSTPEREYEETLIKARAMRASLGSIPFKERQAAGTKN
ncbi:MAG: anthranilate synthase component I family protein [Candidatus Omnitrophica bacterium]|nr:anthranilate synthase component I family protein [Candidatus Omnitrophota bacterium]